MALILCRNITNQNIAILRCIFSLRLTADMTEILTLINLINFTEVLRYGVFYRLVVKKHIASIETISTFPLNPVLLAGLGQQFSAIIHSIHIIHPSAEQLFFKLKR